MLMRKRFSRLGGGPLREAQPVTLPVAARALLVVAALTAVAALASVVWVGLRAQPRRQDELFWPEYRTHI